MKKLINYMAMALACLSMTLVACQPPTTDEPNGPNTPSNPEQPGNSDQPANPEQPSNPDQPTEPEQPKDSTTVYFVNAEAWAAVNAYAWLDGGNPIVDWPGVAAIKTDQQVHNFDVYSYKFQSDLANKIIFNDGTNQTDDLDVNKETPYCYKGEWYASLNDIPSPITKHNGREYVDMGLSFHWAAYNVGAFTIAEKGDFYAWAETTPRTTVSTFTWENYKWGKASNALTKYCDDATYGLDGFTDDLRTPTIDDNPVRQVWRGSWRMPSKACIDELLDPENTTIYVDQDITDANGTTVKGVKIVSKINGNVLYFPYTGKVDNGSLQDDSRGVYVWGNHITGSDLTPTPYKAVALMIERNQGIQAAATYFNRCNGLTIRPVVAKDNIE